MQKEAYTLSELQASIKQSINSKFNAPVWLIAEINSLNEHRSGHCYMELAEKSKTNDRPIATIRATIWASMYSGIKFRFESSTGTKFTQGIKVLVKATVDYHELYGLSINIRDIDPGYTLGDIAQKRKEIIDRLEAENVMDINKSLVVSQPIRKIAIISSENAAGYEDFIKHLNSNRFAYKYDLSLYEASMQGNETEKSVVSAFDKIFENINNYDIVAIIRGGGSKMDLAAFDSYNIAFYITQFPIPVITGIGHERDETVADMVANTKLKTPTAVADFIINNTYEFENKLNLIAERTFELAKDKIYVNNLILTQASVSISKLRKVIAEKQEYCNQIYSQIKHVAGNYLNNKSNELEYVSNQIKQSSTKYLNSKNNELEYIYNRKKIYSKEIIKKQFLNLEVVKRNIKYSVKNNLKNKEKNIENINNNIRLVDPANVLKRGFSITKHNGKIVKNAENLSKGSLIETKLYKSVIKSRVE